jgi:hypothetical protein
MEQLGRSEDGRLRKIGRWPTLFIRTSAPGYFGSCSSRPVLDQVQRRIDLRQQALDFIALVRSGIVFVEPVLQQLLSRKQFSNRCHLYPGGAAVWVDSNVALRNPGFLAPRKRNSDRRELVSAPACTNIAHDGTPLS